MSLPILLGAALCISASPFGPRDGLRVDTVGWTIRDRQVLGAPSRYFVNDPARGLHAVWKDDTGSIRYNFQPHGGGWQWPGGTVVSAQPRNLGGMDVDLVSGRALFGADYISRASVRGSFFRDSAPGAGSFVESQLGRGWRRVLAAAQWRGWPPRFAAVRDDSISYLSSFSSRRLGWTGSFPTHSIAASRNASWFCFLWTSTGPSGAGALMMRETPNNGQNWYATANLSDSFGLSDNRAPHGGQALYDSVRLFVITAFVDGNGSRRSRIWCYVKGDSSPWYLVHAHAIPETALVGDFALAAGRPTIGRNPGTGELFAAWEQFDADNVEPLTGFVRADIWSSRSQDGGRTWGSPVRLTGPDSMSRRFPGIADIVDDTVRVLYFADRFAGFSEQGQGPVSRNAVLVLSLPASELPVAISSPEPVRPDLRRPRPGPTVSRRGFDIKTPGPLRVRVYCPAGRLRVEERLTGPVSDWGRGLPPGVWLVGIQSVGSAAEAGGDPEFFRVVRLPD